jgi:hypothetical protein
LTVLADDGVEVVKAVSGDELEKREDDTDQVALETAEQEQKTIHNTIQSFPHPPPPIQNGEFFEDFC